MESTSYVLSFRMVFIFYLVTTGWIFDISLCENSINQSIMIVILDRHPMIVGTLSMTMVLDRYSSEFSTYNVFSIIPFCDKVTITPQGKSQLTITERFHLQPIFCPGTR